jgi:hypothetical protein
MEASEVMHEGLHIRFAHPSGIVEVHPDTLHLGKGLPQIIARCLSQP